MEDVSQDKEPSKVDVANIVASGKLDVELEIAEVAKDLSKSSLIEETEYSRKNGSRLLIQFPKEDTLGIFVSSGVYIFTGVNSYGELEYARENFLSALSELGIISGADPNPCEVVDPFEVLIAGSCVLSY